MAPRPEWYLLAGTFALAVPLWMARGGPVRNGEVLEIAVSLVPADRARLACLLPWFYDHYRCAFQAEGEEFEPPPSEADRFQPFVTLDREVYLLPGLFLDPAVAAHVARDSTGERFVANCKVEYLRRADGVKIRFSESAPWHEPREPVWLATLVECKVR